MRESRGETAFIQGSTGRGGMMRETGTAGKYIFGEEIKMESCSLSDFIKVIEPWLSKDYIRKVCLEESSRLKLIFEDGVTNTYRIDDCTKSQLEDILKDLKNKGVRIDR